MELNDLLSLSYYREIASVDQEHRVTLVQHTESDKIYIMKTLVVYQRDVYDYLKAAELPGTPKIQELIESDGKLYVVEEYISGSSLQELLETQGCFTEGQVLEVLQQLCPLLKKLHSHSPPIIHRDIKPQNLIKDATGTLYLIDFNSARESLPEQSRDTVLFGTVGYAAPEQYGFGASIPQSDIYAIGVMMNVLLTGKHPSEKLTEGSLAAVIKKCIKLDPGDRYSDADELFKASKNALKHGSGGLSDWLPPGLCGHGPLIRAISLLWYVTIILFSFLENNENYTFIEAAYYRVLMILILLCPTLWVCNYRGVHRYLPLANSKTRWTRIAGIILWGVAIPAIILVSGVVIGLSLLGV